MSSPPSLLSRERNSSALCTALGTAGTVLVLECFRIPDCYMSLSLAATFSLLPRPSFHDIISRIIAFTLGIIASMVVLILFPQAPWFSLPLAGLIPAAGYSFFFKHSGPGTAYSFSAYFLAFYVTASVSFQKTDFFIHALQIWSQSFIAVVMTYLAAVTTKESKPRQPYAKIGLALIVSIFITVSIAIMLDAATKTNQAGRLVMASISTIAFLEIGKSIDLYLQQMIGYFIGVVVATAFLVGVANLGSEISLYLLALGGLFGLLEWLACYFSNHTSVFRGIIAMCSFSIFMIRAPDQNFNVAYGRITTSLVGFFVALAVYFLIREFTKATQQWMAPKTNRLK